MPKGKTLPAVRRRSSVRIEANKSLAEATARNEELLGLLASSQEEVENLGDAIDAKDRIINDLSKRTAIITLAAGSYAVVMTVAFMVLVLAK
jgi:hypothetical protein